MSAEILYIQNDAYCIVLQAVVLFKVLWGDDKQKSQRMFAQLIMAGIFFNLMDLCWGLIQLDIWSVPIWVNYAVNALYYIFAGIIPLRWFLYAEYVQGAELFRKRRLRYLSYLPFIALALLTLVSLKTGSLFYIDADNVYHRGPLYSLQPVLSYGYLIASTALALYRGFKRENYPERSRYLSLASFVIFPFIFGGIQVLIPGIPLLCMGMTLAIIQIYMANQKGLISTDSLTKMNNRGALIRYLGRKMADQRMNKRLYLLLMDIDCFKSVNDRYGHIEGDVALCRVADVLRKVCVRKEHFIARYAGDEFMLVCEADSEEEVTKLCRAVGREMERMNRREALPYILSLSIGYAALTPEVRSIPDFIRLADRQLYAAKKEKKNDPSLWK